MCSLETVTTVPHEDLILCEAVIVYCVRGICAPPASTSPLLGLLALECARDRASRLAHIMRTVLDDACWAAVMAHANSWLQCAVSGELPARPVRSRHVATGMCGVWKVYRVRGAGAEASDSESTRVERA